MKKLCLLLFFFLSLACAAGAETYAVSPEGLTVTEALSQCADGDVIRLSAGVYDETGETFPLVIDKAITLRGGGGGGDRRAAL